MDFVVDRKTWHRGESGSRLYVSETKKQCCIGQVCSQLGVKTHLLKDVGSVQGVMELHGGEDSLEKMNGILVKKGKESFGWLWECYAINDSLGISEEDRESKITEAFKLNGHTITFKN